MLSMLPVVEGMRWCGLCRLSGGRGHGMPDGLSWIGMDNFLGVLPQPLLVQLEMHMHQWGYHAPFKYRNLATRYFSTINHQLTILVGHAISICVAHNFMTNQTDMRAIGHQFFSRGTHVQVRAVCAYAILIHVTAHSERTNFHPKFVNMI